MRVKNATLFIAPLGARNRKDLLFKKILSHHPENDYSSVLYICPNNYVLSEANNLFFSYVKNNLKKATYIPFQSFTLKQIAANIHEAYGSDNLISERLRTLILCELLRDDNLGYARLLSQLLKKIRHYILDKDLLRIKEEIGQLIFEERAKERVVRAIEILESYEDELNEKNVIDTDGMLKNGIVMIREQVTQNEEYRDNPPGTLLVRRDEGESEIMGNINNATLFSYSTLVIDGFFDPTPLEMEFMKALIENADRTFVMTQENTEMLEHFLQQKPGVTVKKLDHAFCREKAGYYAYPSMEEEVEGIARNVKKLVLEGISPWEITVSFPVLKKYLPMVRRIFRKHDIPFSISEYDLSATRPFTALEEMITCIEEDYPRNDFLSVLTSPHFPAIPDIIKKRAFGYSYRAGIIKGKPSWLSVKEIILNSPEKDVSEDERERLDEFRKEMKKIIDIFEDMKQKREMLSFVDAFESALRGFGFFDSLDVIESAATGEEVINKINSLLSELRRFGSLYGQSIKNANPPSSYVRYLLRDLKSSDENRTGVKIVPFEAAAGVESRVLFFGGLIEGEFPSRPDIDPILPEKVKQTMGMPYLEYYLKRQKRYFIRLLNVPVHDPYLSCPSAEGDKIFLPSPFLDWEQPLNQQATDIYTHEEALIREGSAKQNGSASITYRDVGMDDFTEKMFRDKNSLTLLYRIISVMNKGYFSVTDLDYYRRCPLRFYIEKVLCLSVDRPPRFEVEARLWGCLAHKVMENLFREGDIELDDLDDRLLQSLEKSLRHFPIGDFWSGVAKEIFLKLLPRLKEQEADIRMKGFSPFIVEKSLKAEINNLRLKGKIDRIDRKVRGIDESTPNTVMLFDYKSGTVDSNSLQLPLYVGMWQESYPEPVEKAGYYSLMEGKVGWCPGNKSMSDFVQQALQCADELSKGMLKGEFSPRPFRADECRYCAHSPLCKKERSAWFNIV